MLPPLHQPPQPPLDFLNISGQKPLTCWIKLDCVLQMPAAFFAPYMVKFLMPAIPESMRRLLICMHTPRVDAMHE